MKKIICLALASVLVFSLSACSGNGGGSTHSSGGASTSQADGAGSSGASNNATTAASTPSEAYARYTEIKSIAYESISSKMSEHSDLALSASIALLPVALVDLTLIPLTIVGTEGGEAALAFLGMGNIEIAQDGNVYTITYTDSEDVTMTQTCEYDAATDSLKSVISDTSTSLDSLVFEYTKSGDGYISQYAMYDEEDDYYMLIKMYCNADGDVTIGIEAVSDKPDSIFKNTGLTADFAQNDSSYFMLEGGTLTVLSDGETKTY